MRGINLNKPIFHKFSSLRFFKESEHHVYRESEDNVLLLVYDGVLRFSENGKQYEIKEGEYFIQEQGLFQGGEYPSDAPKYLFNHFLCEWADGGAVLPKHGVFKYSKLKNIIDELDFLSHTNAPYTIRAAKFYELLSKLYVTKANDSIAGKIADYIAKSPSNTFSLEELCDRFHFSKNHIINLFKREFGVTPIVYVNNIKLQKAEYLMAVTSISLEDIAIECGFQNYSHFYKLFIREKGCSPIEYRSELRQRQ